MFTAVPLPGHIHSVPEERCARQFLLAHPDEIHALAAVQGAGLSQRGFLAERAHKRAPLVCDDMKIEPFGKPAVWMYQFWQ